MEAGEEEGVGLTENGLGHEGPSLGGRKGINKCVCVAEWSCLHSGLMLRAHVSSLERQLTDTGLV